MAAVLTAAGIRHRRGGREVLRIDGLEVHAGERLGLLGLNGAGKTSLLRLFAAIDLPTAGEVRVDGVAQRVSLARALACDPAALLLDEPAASLDAPTRAALVADVERALAGRPTTIVHATAPCGSSGSPPA